MDDVIMKNSSAERDGALNLFVAFCENVPMSGMSNCDF